MYKGIGQEGTDSEESRFRLDTGRKVFVVRVVRDYDKLPRETVVASYLAVFKARLDGAPSNLVYWKVSLSMAGGVKLDYIEGTFQPKPCHDFMVSQETKPLYNL